MSNAQDTQITITPSTNEISGMRKGLRKPKLHSGFGITFILISLLTIIPEVVRLCLYSRYDLFLTGVGIWNGCIVMIQGVMNIAAFKYNSRRLLASALVVESIALVVMLVSIAMSTFELGVNHKMSYSQFDGSEDVPNFILLLSSAIIISSSIIFLIIIVHLGFCCYELCICCAPRNNRGPIQCEVTYSNPASEPNQTVFNTSSNQQVRIIPCQPGQTSFSIQFITYDGATAQTNPSIAQRYPSITSSPKATEANSATEATNMEDKDLPPDYENAVKELLLPKMRSQD